MAGADSARIVFSRCLTSSAVSVLRHSTWCSQSRNSGRDAQVHHAGIIRNQGRALREQGRSVAEAQLPDVVAGVRRPVEGAAKVGRTVFEIGWRSDDGDLGQQTRQFVEAMPLFPGPVRFAAGMEGDSAGRQVELPTGKGGDGRRQLSLPAQLARDFGNAM